MPCRRGWGSLHLGGVNFLKCDGSVHFFSTSVDMPTLASLATIAGGEAVATTDNKCSAGRNPCRNIGIADLIDLWRKRPPLRLPTR